MRGSGRARLGSHRSFDGAAAGSPYSLGNSSAAAAASSAAAAAASGKPLPPVVLVVDEHPSTRSIISKWMGSAGYEEVSCATGAQAKEYLQQLILFEHTATVPLPDAALSTYPHHGGGAGLLMNGVRRPRKASICLLYTSPSPRD